MLELVRRCGLPTVALALATALSAQTVHADDAQPENREDAITYHIQALERAARSDLSERELVRFVNEFARSHCADEFLATTTDSNRRALVEHVLGVIGRTPQTETTISPLWVRMELFPGDEIHEITFRTQDTAPYAITALEIEEVTDSRPRYTLTVDNLSEVFADLEASGFSGVVHVRKNGTVLLEEAYGMANVEFGYPIKLDTVFGIGSTPMDFTLVSLFLLEQQGKIQQDDTLDTFLKDVPADKAKITIRQLMSGQSGLPDFFDTEDDWDPDLAYINRKTAEARLLSQELLFEPGTKSRHSHGAFGLLSIIIERVSGQDYYTFLKENFFDRAGMTRTAMNGDAMGLPLSEFAVGQGPVFFGLPNIPPNWGKTSWLVLGSGGMCSTLEDMLKFFSLVRSDNVLKPPHNARFNRYGSSLNGSMRGAYLSHVYKGVDDEAIMMSNIDADSPREGDVDEKMRAIVLALEDFIAD